MLRGRFKWVVAVLGITLVSWTVQAQRLQTGVIVLNPAGMTVAEQNSVLDQLAAAHVTLIRTGMNTDNPRIDFARRAYAKGIRIDALIGPQQAKGAPKPANEPGAFYRVWGGNSLGSLDPETSRDFLQSFLDKLEAQGVALGAIELGNEINWAAGSARIANGKVYNFDDLQNDPQAREVAAYYLQYLKCVAAMKDVRDHSRLNRETPILSAGIAAVGPAHDPNSWFTQHGYAVTLTATFHFLRGHGMDKLVDAYAVHYYPKEKTPEARKRFMDTYAAPVCKAEGSTGGKPCWITEWGVDNNNLSCPVRDAERTAVVNETMEGFRDLARQGRLKAVLYYTWNTAPGAQQTMATSLYRCGGLSPAGQSAITP